MRVTIWDLDYYYSKDKVNCFNPDAMKISSYHKQKGDKINFVLSEFDIRRPFDVYYVFRNNEDVPNVPLDFFTNSKIKWIGKTYKVRQYKIPDIVLMCRPDYLLYPEHNTKLERAEHVRLFNNKGEWLVKLQDWSNTFTNKNLIVTDTVLWHCSHQDIISALKKLQEVKNVTFLEPIDLKIILDDKLIRDEFLKLKLAIGGKLDWIAIDLAHFESAAEFAAELKKACPSISTGVFKIKCGDLFKKDWESKEVARANFNRLFEVILKAKQNKVHIELCGPRFRVDTPYWFIYETLEEWCAKSIKESLIEFLSKKYRVSYSTDGVAQWNSPKTWDPMFRDLLRQFYTNKELLLAKWGNEKYPENNVPWLLLEQEFRYGI